MRSAVKVTTLWEARRRRLVLWWYRLTHSTAGEDHTLLPSRKGGQTCEFCENLRTGHVDRSFFLRMVPVCGSPRCIQLARESLEQELKSLGEVSEELVP